MRSPLTGKTLMNEPYDKLPANYAATSPKLQKLRANIYEQLRIIGDVRDNLALEFYFYPERLNLDPDSNEA